ncbi:MAG TPA: phosphotransferase [Roseiflexaceae bacterium]|nr:phosphotransferase [Roseiflexaceae bacterium]
MDELSKLVGAPVVASERSRWGFENRTDLVTLADGRRLVVQQVANRALAAHKLRLGRLLPERLAAVGIATPRQLAADTQADPPYAVREYLPGLPGPSALGSDAEAAALARAMGALLPRLARVVTEGAGLSRVWAEPDRLLALSRRRLERAAALLAPADLQTLASTIDEAGSLLAGRTACFAHGDFCPVNVLLAEPHASSLKPQAPSLTALLDLEFARVADPLFDAAWWGLIVRYHHPARWQVAWPHLLDAAGIPADAETLRRIAAIQRLRCLETIDYYAAFDLDRARDWAGRMQVVLSWEL